MFTTIPGSDQLAYAKWPRSVSPFAGSYVTDSLQQDSDAMVDSGNEQYPHSEEDKAPASADALSCSSSVPLPHDAAGAAGAAAAAPPPSPERLALRSDV